MNKIKFFRVRLFGKAFGVLLVWLLIGGKALAQREPMYSQYMYNIGSFNAAYVGTVESADFTFLVRTQWMGFPGLNNTYRFGANIPLANGKNGIGFNIVSDKLGPTSQTMLDAAYSFQVQLSETTYLSFGLEGGGTFLNTDLSQGTFENPGEPILNTQLVKSLYPTLGAGLFLYNSDWYLGLSAPNLLGDAQYNPEVAQIVADNLQFNFIGGHVLKLSDNLKFKPAFLLNFMSGAPVTTNISASFLMVEKFMIGTSYRFGSAISALFGLQLSSNFYAGYAYDYSANGLQGYNTGSHEIVLKLRSSASSNSAKRKDFGANKIKGKQIDSPRFF
ncbi:MAG: hypothetical protein RLZZ241_102 [Bacteroidota bacterium]|jgi:type IX secretion system PorP/SprF family membrane protein